MRLHLRFALAARLLVVALAVLAGASAGAAPAAAQDSCDGVWVVVDATQLGGDVRTLCAPGAPSNGLEALRAVDVSYTFVERVPGLVCTLDGMPDPCNGAPDDAYWAYWHAEAGGEWVYSNRGAGNRTPPPGSVEGWAFGAGEQPGRTPPAASAAEPAPAPTNDPPPSPTNEPSPTPTTEATASPTPESSPSASSDADAADTGRDAAAGADDAGGTGGGGNDAADPDTADDDATGDADDAATGETDDTTQQDADADADADGENDAADDAEATADVAARAEGDRERPADDEVAIDVAADGGGGGLPVGAIAGAAIVAGLAGAGVLRARRRDDLVD